MSAGVENSGLSYTIRLGAQEYGTLCTVFFINAGGLLRKGRERIFFMNYTPDYFRALAAEKLTYERFQHTIGVESWACRLAEKYGICRNSAVVAALTHDWAKQFSLAEQLKKAKDWNLIYYPEDLENPQVIHGRLAAYILENEYKITDRDIQNAVYNHTLGRPGMSPLEMLITARI
jgi:HD superfamily phosphohydrolase YqeK